MGVTLGVEAKVRNFIRGGRSQLGLASKKLNRNPCVRFAVKAGVDWLSFGFAGLSLCVLIVFFSMLVLGPYLTFTFVLYKLTPWSKSSQNDQGLGFLVLVGSVFFVFMGYRLFMKYPQLRNLDNLSKIESIPIVFQICVYYVFWSFCSMIGSLLTYDFLVVSYFTVVPIFNAFVLIFHNMSRLQWYFILLLLVCAITFLSFLSRVLVHRRRGSSPSAATTASLDHESYAYNSRRRTFLPV